MDKKLGVYICSGCGIGDSLDIEKLSTIATKAYKVPICKTHAYCLNNSQVSHKDGIVLCHSMFKFFQT